MGRAPQTGAPQRVSAHVVPKAAVYAPEIDEDEKTTIESGWEEEASTTVEQGDVAEKIRQLGLDAPRRGNTSVTSTNAGMMDEPTVDDQRANAVIAMLPVPSVSRLVVTNGSDTGHELEVRPGKSYTIGRGMDNDLVLSDIAVSRKHFDLRHEDGNWVIADRGSGNGTLVNGNLEDAPFLLASGDAIEIGNTTFRFEQPNGSVRAAPPLPLTTPIRKSEPKTYDVSLDDEELEPSTMSGKPMREALRPASRPPERAEHRAETRAEHPPEPRPRMSEPIALRPKTLPPPAPLPRPRLPTAPPMPVPVPPYALERPLPLAPASNPNAQTMSPMQAMQAMQAMQPPPPSMSARAPTPRAPSGPPYAQPMLLGTDAGLVPPLPSTIPGQGVSPSYPPYGMSPPMLVISSNAVAPRDATSTAQVPPTPYGGQQIIAAPLYAQPPQLSRRVKLALGGVGLTFLAAIATIAIIRGSSKPAQKAAVAPPAPKPTPVVEHIEAPTVTPVDTRPAPPPPAQKVVTAPPPPPVQKVEPPPVKVETPPPPPPEKVVHHETHKATPERHEAKRTPAPPPEKVVAAADPPRRPAGGNAKAKADALYQAHKFSEAASLLKSAAAGASSDEASQLKSLAGTYEQLGKAYSVGMAPATPAIDAYNALRRALNFDHTAGNMLQSEINERLGAVASKAAISYNAKRDNENAYQAVLTAERLGAGNNSTKTVRDILEGRAGDLYAEASKLMSSDATAAKQKLREITHMVDSKSPWYQKASKLLASS